MKPLEFLGLAALLFLLGLLVWALKQYLTLLMWLYQ